jgi:hypothetical protein
VLHDRNTIHVPSHVVASHAAAILSASLGEVREMIESGDMYVEHWQGFEYIPMCEVIRILNQRSKRGPEKNYC